MTPARRCVDPEPLMKMIGPHKRAGSAASSKASAATAPVAGPRQTTRFELLRASSKRAAPRLVLVEAQRPTRMGKALLQPPAQQTDTEAAAWTPVWEPAPAAVGQLQAMSEQL